MFVLLLSFLILTSLVEFGSAAPEDELITTLPNLTEPLRSKHYAGYLNISEDKQLFYWYVESEENPAAAPTVLWLNGGPGCASMEGLFIEMGPFRVRNDGEQVVRNPWTWNRIANIIYMDAPAGVGYSYYSGNLLTKVYTDDEVAQDNYDALKMWFDKFPERRTNEFYVMGESYGGTYVPMLSAKLSKANDVFPQFKGMLVGNGCVDDKINFNTNVMYQYYHAVVDESQIQTVVKDCCDGSLDCDYYTISQQNSTCADNVNDLSYSIYYSGYDPYFLYFACYVNPDLPYPPHEEIQKLVLKNNFLKKRGLSVENKWVYNQPSEAIHGQPDCASHSDHFPYLNSPEVRKILRIPDYVQKYEMCSMDIAENYHSQYENMKDFFETVINANKRVAMFNGDADSLCNYVENSQFLYKTMNLKLKKKMTYWEDPVQLPKAVGQVTEYEGVTLISIKGGGHFPAATEQKPKETFQMFQNYVQNQNYSTPVKFDVAYGSTTVRTTSGSSTVTPGAPTAGSTVSPGASTAGSTVTPGAPTDGSTVTPGASTAGSPVTPGASTAGSTVTPGAPTDGSTVTPGAPTAGSTVTPGAPTAGSTVSPGASTAGSTVTPGAPTDGSTVTPGAPTAGSTVTPGAPTDGSTVSPGASTAGSTVTPGAPTDGSTVTQKPTTSRPIPSTSTVPTTTSIATSTKAAISFIVSLFLAN